MLTRSVGKVLRGKATPVQIMLACVIGGAIGFLPELSTSVGLTIALLLLLVVLNANLAVAGLVGLASKLVGLLALPLSFEVGRFLLDGPTGGLFKAMINAPVLALFGFEHYATSGALALGALFGAACGLMLIAIVGAFRRKMATLEEGSERYKAYTSKWWVKALLFVFVGGGHGKKTYAELANKRVGNPIRPLGVVFAALVVGLFFIVQSFLSGPIVTMAVKRGLERANGATVDLAGADFDLRSGRMTLTGLALADVNDVTLDSFRASRVEGAISASDLLRKRFAIDTLTIAEGVSGAKRAIPGRVLRPARPAPPPDDSEKTIDDYLREAQLWKERLAQARQWVERVSGPARDPSDEARETLEERLRRRAREQGYARVKADHLLEGAPTVLIREVVAEGVRVEKLPGEVFDVRGENLSTQPWLAGQPRLRVASRSGDLLVNLGVDEPRPGAADAALPLEIVVRGVAGDRIGQALKFVGEPPVRGGTADFVARGSMLRGVIELPVTVTLKDTTLSMPRVGSERVSNLTFPFGLQGPMDNPRVMVSEQAFADALLQAGAGKLAAEARSKADEAVGRAAGKLGEQIGEKLGEQLGTDASKGVQDAAKGALESLLGGGRKRDEAPKKDEPKKPE